MTDEELIEFMQPTDVFDVSSLRAIQNAAMAERDAARAVIAYAEAAISNDGERDYLERIYATQNALAQSPESALAKVKADALREAASRIGVGPQAETIRAGLLAEADRIEKEAGL